MADSAGRGNRARLAGLAEPVPHAVTAVRAEQAGAGAVAQSDAAYQADQGSPAVNKEARDRLRTFAKRLYVRRFVLGMSSKDLCRDLGVSHTALRGWEEGASIPCDADLRAWARRLDVEVPSDVEGRKGTRRGRPVGSRNSPTRHGTIAGYSRHRYYREEPCEPCRQAMAQRKRELRAATRAH